VFRVANTDFQTDFLSRQTREKLSVMMFLCRYTHIPNGTEYLSMGLPLVGQPFKRVWKACKFDWLKRLRHSGCWGKIEAHSPSMGRVIL
jgi:hypothetical protein